MASNQEGVQAAIRASTGTTLDYNGDWSALFNAAGIATGSWNGRLLAWINVQLGTSHASLPQAQQAYATANSFTNWSSMNTLTLGPGGAANAILLEDGIYGLLLESGSYILMEV